MMQKRLFQAILFVSLSIILGCKAQKGLLSESSKQIERRSIEQVMESQEKFWNAGDIDGFMEGYWKSDSLRFSGSSITYGWEATRERYKRAYPNKEIMGTLEFEIIDLDFITRDAAIMLGRYRLERSKDSPTGLFTLMWKKIGGKWVITSDMTCG